MKIIVLQFLLLEHLWKYIVLPIDSFSANWRSNRLKIVVENHWSFRLHIRVCAYVDFEFFISFCCFCVSSELMHVRLNDVCRFLSRTMNWEWWQVMGTYWFTGNKHLDEFILFYVANEALDSIFWSFFVPNLLD